MTLFSLSNRVHHILLFGIIGCLFASSESGASGTDVATVNGKGISLEYLNKKLEEVSRLPQAVPPTKQAVLEDLIKRELGIQEARRLGLEKDPVVMDRINTVIYQSYLEKALAKSVEAIFVSDEEARSFYDKKPELRTSHIFISVLPSASKEEENRAYEKMKSILATHVNAGKMSFAEIAQRFSDGAAAPMGGDLDYQTFDRFDPKFYAAALELKRPGAVSGVVRSSFGYHIIKLTAVRPWKDTDQPKVKRLLIEEKRQRLFESHMAALRAKAKVTIAH
jgi:peptidyl-prolyl cis-trans isomerase C